MNLLSIEDYIKHREAYSYEDPGCRFEILQTNGLNYTGEFHGIFAGSVPATCIKGVNLRKFEAVCEEVFNNCCEPTRKGILTKQHAVNLRSITYAIVHWKMASQGGRASKNVKNIQDKWTGETVYKLIKAYRNKDIHEFMIPGIRIPTATAFMRFLFPDIYGIMDSRVARLTQKHNLTSLSIREDGYINDTARNIKQYNDNYIPFLQQEAYLLNKNGARFIDFDISGKKAEFKFRPCDVEMALWKICSP